MAIATETIQRAEELLRCHLKDNFGDRFVFDPIIVEPGIDQYGNDKMDIYVVYDGDDSRLDPRTLNNIGSAMALQLEYMGVEGATWEHYIEKSEYPEWLELRDPANWMAEMATLAAELESP